MIPPTTTVVAPAVTELSASVSCRNEGMLWWEAVQAMGAVALWVAGFGMGVSATGIGTQSKLDGVVAKAWYSVVVHVHKAIPAQVVCLSLLRY